MKTRTRTLPGSGVGTAWAVLAAVSALAPGALAATYSVGPATDGCTNISLQAAINAAVANASGPHLIKLRTGTQAEPNPLLLHNPLADITIAGGYASCGSGTPTTNARSTIDGTGGADGTVLDVRSSTSPARVVTFERVTITGGSGEQGPFANPEGGGLELRGNLTVRLEGASRVEGNATRRGGGALMQGGPGFVTLRLNGGSSISDNQVTNDGGGVWCWDLGKVVIDDGSVEWNRAGRHGGGLFLGNQCGLEVAPLGNGSRLISFNEAGLTEPGSGGGIYSEASDQVFGPYQIYVDAPASSPLFLIGNQASETGGGAFLKGTGAFRIPVSLSNAEFINNVADQGGALQVVGAIEVSLRGAPGCTSLGGCSLWNGNQSVNGGLIEVYGIGFPAGRQPIVRAERLRLSGNTGTSVLRGWDPQSIQINTTIIDGNLDSLGGGTLLVQFDGIEPLRLYYSTLTGNSHGFMLYTSGSSIHAFGSIIWNPGSVLVGGGPVTHGSCLIAHEAAGVTPGVTVENPLLDASFTPAAAGALDACDNLAFTPPADFYGRVRPIDIPWHPNRLGAYDLGAVEKPIPPDLIFKDGFQ